MPHFDHFLRPGEIYPYMNHKWRFSKETPRHTKHDLNVNLYLKIAIMNNVYKGDLHNLTWFQVLKESDLQCTPISIELLFVPIRKKFHQRAPFTNLQNKSWLLRFQWVFLYNGKYAKTWGDRAQIFWCFEDFPGWKKSSSGWYGFPFRREVTLPQSSALVVQLLHPRMYCR